MTEFRQPDISIHLGAEEPTADTLQTLENAKRSETRHEHRLFLKKKLNEVLNKIECGECALSDLQGAGFTISPDSPLYDFTDEFNLLRFSIDRLESKRTPLPPLATQEEIHAKILPLVDKQQQVKESIREILAQVIGILEAENRKAASPYEITTKSDHSEK